MLVIYHLGAHCTDAEKFVRWLLRDRAAVAPVGTVIPGPNRFRPVLRDALQSLGGRAASEEAQEALLDAIMDEDSAERLVLSNENFLSVPANVLEHGLIYPRAGEKAAALRRLFADQPAEFHLAIRNPATFLPALFSRPNGPQADLTLSLNEPMDLRWSDTVRQIRRACPDAPVTVWCDEDTPLILQDVLQDITGADTDTAFHGTLEVLESLITDEGMRKLRGVLRADMPAAKRHRLVAEHLERFARPGAMDVEIDLPGWTEDLVDRLTDAYDEDVERIAALDGVDVIRP